MMPDVAIKAGMIRSGLATPAVMAAFFTLIDRHKGKSSDGTLGLITDRLYRRTVQGEQLDAFERQLSESRRILQGVPVIHGFWDEFDLGSGEVDVDLSATNAAAAFERIYEVLMRGISFARLDQKDLGYIRPMRLVAYDGPTAYEHDDMPMEDFGKPDIRPIWLE